MEVFIVMYHGGVLPGRGIETLIELVNINENINGIILGDGREEYVEKLKNKAGALSITGRLLFHPAVNNEDLWRYVGAADVGLILAPAVTKNSLFSLPNKLFENIQSGTPIICPHYPEMKRLVDQYGVGLTCNPNNIEDINNCVERLRMDDELYAEIKGNVMKAQDVLNWDKERDILCEAYRRLIA